MIRMRRAYLICVLCHIFLTTSIAQDSFKDDVIKKADSSKITAPDGKPTLFSYRRSTVKLMIEKRVVDPKQPLPTDVEMERRISNVLELSKELSSSSGRTALDKNHKLLHEGARITAMWKGGESWYGGHVDFVNEDGTIHIQYDDGDYEWYVRTEAYVKAAASKDNERTKTLIKADENILLGGKVTHDLYTKVKDSVTRHLDYVPKDGEIKYTREHAVLDAHFGGSDLPPSEALQKLTWSDGEHTILNEIEEADMDVRSFLEANMQNGRIGTLTDIEIASVLQKSTASYRKGVESSTLYLQRRAHVSFSRMHELLWASNSAISITEWAENDQFYQQLNNRNSNGNGNDNGKSKNVDSSAGKLVGLHWAARRHHLERAAELGSPEAQSTLGIDLLQPSPDPTDVAMKDRDSPPVTQSFGESLHTRPMADAPRDPMLSAWTRRADAHLHLSFASAANDPFALMTLGHQHYFHHYEKDDQTRYPLRETAMDGSDKDSELQDAARSLDESGSFVTKSCSASYTYYERVANIVEHGIMRRGIHVPKEPALLSVEENDGIQGRRHAQFHGSSPTVIGGPVREEDGRRTVMKRANGASDEVVKYYKYQAQSHVGNQQEMAKHDQDLGEVHYFGVRNVERNAVIAAKYFRVAAETGHSRALGMLGHLYARGHGVPSDASRAYSMYYAGTEGTSSPPMTRRDRLAGGKRLSHAGLGLYLLFGVPIDSEETDSSSRASSSTTTNPSQQDEQNADEDDINYGVDNQKYIFKRVDYWSAREHIQRAANSGDASAYYMLGKMRLLGLFVRPDAKKAHALFAKSAQNGNPLAKRMMARMSMSGIGTQKSCVTSIKYLKDVAENAGPWMSDMERAHAHWRSGNVRMSLALYTKMSTLGYSRAQANAAWILEKELYKQTNDGSRGGKAVGNRYNTLGVQMYAGATTVMNSILRIVGLKEGPKRVKKPRVWCGGHAARSCRRCPFDSKNKMINNGEVWCNGQCIWKNGQCRNDPTKMTGSKSTAKDDKGINDDEDSRTTATMAMGRERHTSSDVLGERALYLYSQAASQGHEFALLKMGDLVFYGFAGADKNGEEYDDYEEGEDEYSMVSAFYNFFQSTTAIEPDYPRAKALYQRATSARQSAHVQSQAKFALGWMHEIGYPKAGVPRDVHLAKRMYDDASSLSRDAYAPVRLALFRMRASAAIRKVIDSDVAKKCIESMNVVRKMMGKKTFLAGGKNHKKTAKEIEEEKHQQKINEVERVKKEEQEAEKIKKRTTKDMIGETVHAGHMVKARWRNGRTYFTGYISKIQEDGTMNIQYDDGDVEIHVKSHLVQRVNGNKLHPVYVRLENNERARKKVEKKARESSDGRSSGTGTGTGTEGTGAKGKGWFSESFLVRLLVWYVDWDVVVVMAVGFLCLIFAGWLLRQFTKPMIFWSILGWTISRLCYFFIMEEL